MKRAMRGVIIGLAVTGIAILVAVQSRGPESPGSAVPATASPSPDVAATSTKIAATRTRAPTSKATGFRSPAPSLPPLSIPESLKVVFGAGGESFVVRQEAVQQLGSNLSDLEVEALYHLLYRKAGEDPLQAGELNALKNEVVNVLKKQRRNPALLVRHLIAMFDDPAQDAVWHDYCVQHLGTLCRAVEGPDRTAVRELLWRAAEERQSGVAGTALIALVDNLEGTDSDRQMVRDKALAIATAPDYADAARITALQISAKLEDRRILPLARSIAEGGHAVPLRASAIAAIGSLGDSTDRPLLEKYSQSTDIRLRTAAASALNRLAKRPSG